MTMLIPMPFQEEGRDFLANRSKALLADDMGIGKTLQSQEAIKKCNLQAGIILCPQSIRHSWVRKTQQQIPNVFVKEIKTSRTHPEPGAINVINYDIVWRQPLFDRLKEFTWPFLLCDESHFMRNAKAKRTRAILGPAGLHRQCERKWMMTGTPILNRPIELYPMLRALFPERLGRYANFYDFAYKFCEGFQGPFGFDCTGASNLEQLQAILAPVMLRRLKEEVLTDIPEVIYDKVYLDASDKLISLMRKLEGFLEANKIVGEIDSVRKAIGVIKSTAAIQHIKDILEEKDKVLVFVWHHDVAERIKKAFGDKAVLHTGRETPKKKEEAKEKFINNPDVKVFVGNIQSTGYGVDGLQEACDTCFFAELSYTPKEIEQAIDRLVRIGQKNRVMVRVLVTEKSIEEDIIDTLAEKSRNINTIMGERRGHGVEFLETKCHICKKTTEMSKLRRVLHLTVCEECTKFMECLI